jgi:hypothetical protein
MDGSLSCIRIGSRPALCTRFTQGEPEGAKPASDSIERPAQAARGASTFPAFRNRKSKGVIKNGSRPALCTRFAQGEPEGAKPASDGIERPAQALYFV